jgi:hypothetical protein
MVGSFDVLKPDFLGMVFLDKDGVMRLRRMVPGLIAIGPEATIGINENFNFPKAIENVEVILSRLKELSRFHPVPVSGPLPIIDGEVDLEDPDIEPV